MVSHEYLRFLLKTPTGFLTFKGTTQDICDEDIIILNVYGVGGWMASNETMILHFLKFSTATDVNPNECEVWCHCCNDLVARYNCEDCGIKSSCDFVNSRKKCEFQIL